VPQQSALTASWIGSRWAIDPVALEVRRRALEVYAYREPGSEWLYPGWQFEDDGSVKPEVARALAAAREAGIGPERLTQILNRRAGMGGGKTLLDTLAEGDERQVLAELRR